MKYKFNGSFHFLLGVSLTLLSTTENLKASALQLISLDQHIQFILHDTEHSPLESGEAKVRLHPTYKSLQLFANQLGTQIEWVDSVPKRVLEFPPVADRMKVNPNSKIVGWFDEYQDPNVILLDRNTNLSTLVHELRHTLHLGKLGFRMGNAFDKEIQSAKAQAARFRETLEKSDLPQATIQRLRLASIHFVEFSSEVMAYSDDLIIAEAFDDSALGQSLIKSRNEQWKKFLQNYRSLKSHRISQNEAFVDGLKKTMDDFYQPSGQESRRHELYQ